MMIIIMHGLRDAGHEDLCGSGIRDRRHHDYEQARRQHDAGHLQHHGIDGANYNHRDEEQGDDEPRDDQTGDDFDGRLFEDENMGVSRDGGSRKLYFV